MFNFYSKIKGERIWQFLTIMTIILAIEFEYFQARYLRIDDYFFGQLYNTPKAKTIYQPYLISCTLLKVRPYSG